MTYFKSFNYIYVLCSNRFLIFAFFFALIKGIFGFSHPQMVIKIDIFMTNYIFVCQVCYFIILLIGLFILRGVKVERVEV